MIATRLEIQVETERSSPQFSGLLGGLRALKSPP